MEGVGRQKVKGKVDIWNEGGKREKNGNAEREKGKEGTGDR